MSDLTTFSDVDAFMASATKEGMRDAMDLGDAATKDVGSAAGQVCAADDTRLSDARTPTAHIHDDRYYTESEVDAALSGKSDSGHTHSAATTSVAGFMSATDKQRVDAAVQNTGAETIAGVKTFSSFPITPSAAPTADYQVANKKYIDDAVAGLGGGGVAGSARFRAYKSASQSISAATETTVTFNTEEYDNASVFASNAATIPNGEGWLIGAFAQHLNSNVASNWVMRLKNGATTLRERALGIRPVSTTDDQSIGLQTLVVGSGDPLTITVEQTGATRDIEAGVQYCEFWGVRLW